MARVLTKRNYESKKWNKPSTMSLVVSTLHIVLVRGSTPHRLRVRAWGGWAFWPNFRPKFALFRR